MKRHQPNRIHYPSWLAVQDAPRHSRNRRITTALQIVALLLALLLALCIAVIAIAN